MAWLRSKFKKIKRYLFAKKPKPSTEGRSGGIVKPEDEVEDEVIRRNEGAHRIYKKVALVGGHDDDSSGCASYPVIVPSDFPDSNTDKPKKRREYDINRYVISIAKRIIDLASFSMIVKLFSREGSSVRGVGRKLEKFKPDLVISAHKNSVGHKSDVEGREILAQRKFKGTFCEDEIRRMLRIMAVVIGPSKHRGDDGIRWVDNGDRGEYNLDVYDDCGAKVIMLLEEEFIGKATPTARNIMEGDGLENNGKAIAYFCLGYDVINGELVAP